MKIKVNETLIIVYAFLIFYLNDILFLIDSSPAVFYTSDYLLKGILFILILLSFKTNNDGRGYLRFSGLKAGQTVFWTVLLVTSGILIDQLLWRSLETVIPGSPWQLKFYPTQNTVLKIFDLSVGIFLVAFTEEYIFRYLVVKKAGKVLPRVSAIILALVLFGFAHWSFGPVAIITTALWAVLPMISVLRLRSLIPAMIAHFVTDVIAFSGII